MMLVFRRKEMPEIGPLRCWERYWEGKIVRSVLVERKKRRWISVGSIKLAEVVEVEAKR